MDKEKPRTYRTGLRYTPIRYGHGKGATPPQLKREGPETAPGPQHPEPTSRLRRRVALLHLFLHRGLSRRQPRDGHTVGRAAHVIQPCLGEELDRGRIAAVFAADSHLQLGIGLAPFRSG